MTQLTIHHLQDMINQVLEDAFKHTQLDYPDELIAEPTTTNQHPPEDLTEGNEQSIDTKLIGVLQQLPKARRMAIFARFGMYTQQALLRNINSVQKATKGSL